MTSQTPFLSPLETALAKLKKREESLWGRVESWNHRWLSRLECHPRLQSYVSILRRSSDATALSHAPAIDIDSLFFFSLFLHILLILLLMRLSFAPQLVEKPQPILVQLLDLGQPASAGVEKPKSRPQKKPQARPKAPPAPPAEPKPAIAEAKAAPEPKPIPEPKPAPALPAPKVLAQAPRERAAVVTRPVESLVQLPRQSESGQGSAAARAEPSPAAGVVEPIPEGLRRGETLQRPGKGGSAGVSALASPDFGPYLEKIKKRVESVWQYPEGLSGTHQVNLVFVLDRTGRLVRAEILDTSDPRLNSTALQAVRRASPFPPIPDSLRELAGSPLRIRFNIDFGVKSKR